jgi:hypothetical protein
MLARKSLLKRTPFQPTKPNPMPGPRTRKCGVKGCDVRFVPRSMLHKACGPEHAELIGATVAAKQKAKAKKAERAKDRITAEALKTLPELLREAQREFNRFIRFRDRLAGFSCISSGRPLDWSGNATDAGHYRSVGAAGHLRFNEDNVHAQSKHDNQYKAGNVVEYRINLIARIGSERVEALESNNTVHKWTKDEVRGIRDTYRAKANQLAKELKDDAT